MVAAWIAKYDVYIMATAECHTVLPTSSQPTQGGEVVGRVRGWDTGRQLSFVYEVL